MKIQINLPKTKYGEDKFTDEQGKEIALAIIANINSKPAWMRYDKHGMVWVDKIHLRYTCTTTKNEIVINVESSGTY